MRPRRPHSYSVGHAPRPPGAALLLYFDSWEMGTEKGVLRREGHKRVLIPGVGEGENQE